MKPLRFTGYACRTARPLNDCETSWHFIQEKLERIRERVNCKTSTVSVFFFFFAKIKFSVSRRTYLTRFSRIRYSLTSKIYVSVVAPNASGLFTTVCISLRNTTEWGGGLCRPHRRNQRCQKNADSSKRIKMNWKIPNVSPQHIDNRNIEIK